MSGSGGKVLTDGGVLNNLGTTIWTGTGELWLGGTNPNNGMTTFNNIGTFEAQNNVRIVPHGSVCCPYGVFNNSGIFRKTNSTGQTLINWSLGFINTGTVDVQSGELLISADTQNTGVFNTASGSTTWFSSQGSSPQYVFNQGTTFTGAGLIRFGPSTGNSTFIMNSPVSVLALQVGGGIVSMNGNLSVGTLDFSSGEFRGSGILTVTGTMNWTGGTVSGPSTVTIASGAILNMSGSSLKIMGDGAVLNNLGTAIWTGER